MVLQPENRCHSIEAWQSHPSQGRHFLREEEDQGQMGAQASWGSMSDHNRHPLIWSERPGQTFTCPTSQLTPPHCIRCWHSLACGCLPSTGWMYQSHPSQAYSQREWQQDNATRRWWSGNHPASGQEDSPRVDQWEATASPMDVSWSIHWRWVKIPGNVWWVSLLTEWLAGLCAFGGGIDVSASSCHQIADWMTTTTTHRTGIQ